MPQPTPAERIAQRKRAIFAACKANGVDDDARRLIVKNITGCSSMADCTLLQLGEVLDHLNRGKGGYAGRKRVTPSAERAPLLEKIDALLAAAGSDKQHILSAQIWLKNIERDFAAFNEVWVQWMPEGYSPARAAVQAEMARPEILVEIMLTAVKA